MLNKSNKIKAVLMCMVLMVATACSNEPKLDVSSEQALVESTQKILKSLPMDKQLEFSMALAHIASYTAVDAISKGGGAAEMGLKTQAKFREKVHGKTAEQIIATSKKLKNK